MARILKVNARHRLVFGVALVVSLLVGGAMAIAAVPASQFQAGSVRLASGFSTDAIDITGTSAADSLKRVLRTTISVPGGQVADVQASFSASLHPLKGSGTYAFCFAYFTVDSQISQDPLFRPGSTQLIGGAHASQPDAVGVAMNGFRKGIGPGTHYINVYVASDFQGCELQERDLNVVVNIH